MSYLSTVLSVFRLLAARPASLVDVPTSTRYVMRTGWVGAGRVVCLDRPSEPHYRVDNHIIHDFEEYRGTRIRRGCTVLSAADLVAADYVPCTKYGEVA